MRISIRGKSSKRFRNSDVLPPSLFSKENRGDEGFRNIKTKKEIKEQIKIRNPQSAIRNGFTLLEISLVILLIGIILSLVLPNIGIHKSRLEKEREIEQLSQTIKYLYDLSQIQNKEIILLFDLDENKFQAVSLIDGEEEYILSEKRLSYALKIQDIVNSEGDKITQGTVSLTFNPAGFVEPATIHFIDKDAKFYTLSINPLTGQSRVEDGYQEEK